MDSGLCARLGGVMNLTPLGSVAIDFAATHYRWTADWVGGGDKLRKFFSGKGHNLRRVKASKFVKQVKGAAKVGILRWCVDSMVSLPLGIGDGPRHLTGPRTLPWLFCVLPYEGGGACGIEQRQEEAGRAGRDGQVCRTGTKAR